MNNRGDVVVGVDGSRGARAAVAFAAAEAVAHGARLRIVSAWSSTSSGMASMSPVVVPNLAHELEARARQRLDEAAALAREVAPEVELELQAPEGSPGAVLVEASRNCRLLVVGSRGRSAVQELLLGSVSHHLVLHALCPVLVVPPHVDDSPPVHGAD